VDQGQLLMSQAERDRLVALKKAKKKLITQKQAAEEIGVTERQVRRLLRQLRKGGDKAVIHALRGRPSNRKLPAETEQEAMEILRDPIYRGFGPTLAAEYLDKKHGLKVGKETLRQWMSGAGLWKPHRRRIEAVHQWRPRRSCCGELVQWDTSEHDWLEGRGEKIYLVAMIDDATSRLFARFVRHDSTAENMRVLREYLERFGRPMAFYTDKAGLFQTAVKTKRGERREGKDGREMPPTQIGRALRELNVAWIPAHSPQAKGRVERGFSTAQDRLVKGLRVAGVSGLEEANAYLEAEYLPWWNQTLAVTAANSSDAHRRLGREHDLAAILSHVEERQVSNDYTVRYQGNLYQIDRRDVRVGLRGSRVRVELRLDGSIAMRFSDRYLRIGPCQKPQPAAQTAKPATPAQSRPRPNAAGKSRWMDGFFERPSLPLKRAIAISNATS
jgi:transposase